MKSSLLFAVAFSFSRYISTFLPFANAALVNITIDDSDTSTISYSPSANWQPSISTSCTDCVQPQTQFAFRQTLHYATHPDSPPDGDDQSSPSSAPSSTTALPPPPPPSSSPVPTSIAPASTQTKGGGDAGNDDGGHGKQKGKAEATSRQMVKLRRTDSDDKNFIDKTVAAGLNFTGSAVYVFCAVPVLVNKTSILAKTNLTFFLDGEHVGSFNRTPRADLDSSTESGLQYQILVFFRDDLPFGQHQLSIRPELGSMALLDYVQYTTIDSSGSTTNGSSVPAATPSGSVNSQKGSSSTSKKNTATFAAAIGSTVGVLALISCAVFVSIYRRRRKSAKRDKRLEAEEAAARPSSPEMRGPQPFIPRYFPGNPIPALPSSPPSLAPPSSTISSEEIGPSHGLDFPPAPEHLDAPAYSPPPLALSEQTTRVPGALRPPVMRMPSSIDETELPRYQDVGRTPLVSIATLVHELPPPALAESPSSAWPPGSPTSITGLIPKRPGSEQGDRESAAGCESSIHLDRDERPR